MITKENCSTEALSQILESAFIDHSIDGNHITVRMGRVKTLVEANVHFVNMLVFWMAEAGLSEQSLLSSVNAINNTYKFPKVYLHNGTIVVAQFAMLVGAGIPERSLVEALRLMSDLLTTMPELDAITS
ncbi:YbjN_AmyR-like domain containing protein [Fimbriimonadaceae bacterium]